MSLCTACPSGKYGIAMAAVDLASGCTDCPMGMFQDQAGKTSCRTCKTQEYTWATGSSACLSCMDPGRPFPDEAYIWDDYCPKTVTVPNPSKTGQYEVQPLAGQWYKSLRLIHTLRIPGAAQIMCTISVRALDAITMEIFNIRSRVYTREGDALETPSTAWSSPAREGEQTWTVTSGTGSVLQILLLLESQSDYFTRGMPPMSFNWTATGCAAGYYIDSLSNECIACPYAKISSQPGSTACLTCQEVLPIYNYGLTNRGYGPNKARTACVPCGTGEFAFEDRNFGECYPCVEGTYVAPRYSEYWPYTQLPNKVYPNDAYPQWYWANQACNSCPPGSYSTVTGATSAGSCQTCPVGKYDVNVAMQLDVKRSRCDPCPAGTYDDDVSSRSGMGWPPYYCKPCPLGLFAPSTGSLECQQCPYGSFTSQVGAGTCEPCPAGQYSNPQVIIVSMDQLAWFLF
jgi:hypothetical protein